MSAKSKHDYDEYIELKVKDKQGIPVRTTYVSDNLNIVELLEKLLEKYKSEKS